MKISPVLWATLLSLTTTGLSTGAAIAPPALAFKPEEQTRIELYERTSPAVVTIQVGQGSGSGSLITASGLVLTNHHVIEGSARGQVLVVTATGERYRGQVLASDRRQDLALVQILSAQRFPAIELGNPAQIRVGQEVYAIGSPFGLSGTLTTGILSRIAPNGDLQTDAAINQGNSGGPLLNAQGQLIGVNKAIVTPSRGNVGIGFATNLSAVLAFLDREQEAIAQATQLARQPQPTAPRLPPTNQRSARSPEPVTLGIEITSDLIIRAVESGSVADTSGLRPGDRIVAIDRRRVLSVRDIQAFLQNQPDFALVTVVRRRRLATLQLDFR